MKKGIDGETDSTESDAESSRESDSDSSQSITDEDNERTVIEAKTVCRRFVKGKTSYDSSNRLNTEDNVDKLRHNDFRGLTSSYSTPSTASTMRTGSEPAPRPTARID